MARKKDHDYGTGIPRFKMEALARILLPEIQRFYESAEGQAARAERLNDSRHTYDAAQRARPGSQGTPDYAQSSE